MYHKLIYLLGACIVFLSSSCTHRLTDFTIISTKNVPVGQSGPVEFVKGDKRVKGKDVCHIIIFPIGSPNLKEAIDRAIESTPGAVGLVDGVVKEKSWTALLYGQNSFIVEGTPLFVKSENDTRAAYTPNTTIQQYGQQPSYQNYQPTNYSQPSPQNQTTLVFFHEVKPGETIADIARLYKVEIADIIKWNKLSSSNLTKGSKLTIHLAE